MGVSTEATVTCLNVLPTVVVDRASSLSTTSAGLYHMDIRCEIANLWLSVVLATIVSSTPTH